MIEKLNDKKAEDKVRFKDIR